MERIHGTEREDTESFAPTPTPHLFPEESCVHTHVWLCIHAHTHVQTICLHIGWFLSQLCGGQASSYLAEEGQTQPDGLHLCLITTQEAGWTQPQHSETQAWNGQP